MLKVLKNTLRAPAGSEGPRRLPRKTERSLACLLHLRSMTHLYFLYAHCLLHDLGCLRLSVARVGSLPRHRYAKYRFYEQQASDLSLADAFLS